DQAAAILADRRDHGLDRLLAQLLGTLGHALVEELARIGRVGRRLRAHTHALFEVMEGEIGHRFCSTLHITSARPRKSGRCQRLPITARPASITPCRPHSISGSISPRPTPIRRRYGL